MREKKLIDGINITAERGLMLVPLLGISLSQGNIPVKAAAGAGLMMIGIIAAGFFRRWFSNGRLQVINIAVVGCSAGVLNILLGSMLGPRIYWVITVLSVCFFSMEILKTGNGDKGFIKIAAAAAGAFFILSAVTGLLSAAGLATGFTVILLGLILGALRRWV